MQRPRVILGDDRVLVIHKPPGVSFHAEGHTKGIVQILREMEEDGSIPKGERLYPVHRLDKVTSGILIFARGRKTANLLSNEFRHNRVEKYYLALSDRKPKKNQGWIRGDMEKGRHGAWILTRTNNRPAITYFISRPVVCGRAGVRLYLVRPLTGRTHQIRVALKSLGSPIIGDAMYGRYDLAREEDRTYLHAYAAQFKIDNHPYRILSLPEEGSLFLHPQVASAVKNYHPFQMEWPAALNKKSIQDV